MTSRFLCLAVVVVIVLMGSVASQCVWPQSYWLGLARTDWPQQVQQAVLCGTPWYDLMRVELLQLSAEEQMTDGMWLLFFHQTCAMALNQAALSTNITLPLSWQSLLVGAIDILERGCTNTSGWCARWQYDPNVGGMFEQMTAFNRGQILPQYPSCEPADSSLSSLGNISYLPVFGNMTHSLFAVVLPTNETVWQGSAFFGLVSVQASQLKILLIVVIGAFLVLGAIVGVMFCRVTRNKKRNYHWQSNEDEEEEEEENIDPSDMTIELDGEIATTTSTTGEKETI